MNNYVNLTQIKMQKRTEKEKNLNHLKITSSLSFNQKPNVFNVFLGSFKVQSKQVYFETVEVSQKLKFFAFSVACPDQANSFAKHRQ